MDYLRIEYCTVKRQGVLTLVFTGICDSDDIIMKCIPAPRHDLSGLAQMMCRCELMDG